jgi:hypothetical protein
VVIPSDAENVAHDGRGAIEEPPVIRGSERGAGDGIDSTRDELDDPVQEKIEGILRKLRPSLRMHDRVGFSRALPYPVAVNGTGCRFTIASPRTFAAHFEEIVTKDIERAILDESDGPAGKMPTGYMLYGGFVWFPNEGPQTILFNTNAWLPGLPCDNLRASSPPSWLSGTWTPTSIGVIAFHLDQSEARWEHGALRFDVRSNSWDFKVVGPAKHCPRARYGILVGLDQEARPWPDYVLKNEQGMEAPFFARVSREELADCGMVSVSWANVARLPNRRRSHRLLEARNTY